MNHDEAFDQRLRDGLQAEPEPADDGFTQRVMAALPAQRVRRHTAAPARAMRLAALMAAQSTLALLLLAGLPDLQAAIAVAVLLALLAGWSWRWRGLLG